MCVCVCERERVCVCVRERERGCTAAVVVGALEDNVEVAEPLAHLPLHVVLMYREKSAIYL